MATKTKIERLRLELESKYGKDMVVVVFYDYYKAHLVDEKGEYPHNRYNSSVQSYTLETVPVEKWDYKRFDRIGRNLEGPEYVPVEIKESRDLFESPEQQELRKKSREAFATVMRRFAGIYATPYYLFENTRSLLDLWPASPTPKEFGMAVDNKRLKKWKKEKV